MKEQWVLQKHWNVTIPWLNFSKYSSLLFLWFDLNLFSCIWISLLVSLDLNHIADDKYQRIENALEINRNLFQIWTQRKHFLIFLSQLSNTPLSSDNVNVVRENVRIVLELEEMKREITKFLWDQEQFRVNKRSSWSCITMILFLLYWSFFFFPCVANSLQFPVV